MTGLTTKGAATRDRIVRAATELILERGVAGMTLDEIRVGTRTSKSQLFHYFPGGKSELVGAIAGFQNARVMAAQEPWLDRLDTWESWQGWRDAVVAYYRNLTHKYCSVSALVNDVAPTDPRLAAEVAAYADRWREQLAAGLRRMREAGRLRPDADPDRLALAVFAALQGGLLVMQSHESIEPLEAVLDGTLLMLRSYAVHSSSTGAA
ncbi:TetR/AcrR family transcriptional regulator [Actinoplanes sp. LDG1-06]|uniref:TetR/AcrR family transcriptional regulator n=1 Tax=Paractinoplanes ovalisporus TaxID=2810368 RepID=A0ABS2A6P5_9ACTN|nr:TetR/AcrR family transcriptional regulator [Actinoplanes ovalisporus]MBM2614916.1 TetR/AcrR family transcriptional regulator [Actinoplanes ovalisporus]